MEDRLRPAPDRHDGKPRLSAIREALSLECLAPPRLDVAVETGFASDVLSEVLIRAPRGCVLVTAQSSMNVVAVAVQTGISGVIVTGGHRPTEDVVARAGEEGIAVYTTTAETFEVAGRLSRLGLHGSSRRHVRRTSK